MELRDTWLNARGYDAWPHPRNGWWEKLVAKELFDVCLRQDGPLTAMLVDEKDVTLIQMRREFTSDGGSTPRFAYVIPGYSRTAYPRATFHHDSEYAEPHMVWMAKVSRTYVENLFYTRPFNEATRILLEVVTLRQCPTTRAEADARLRRLLPLDGCPAYRATIYWAFVRACGPRWKGETDRREIIRFA